MHHVNASKRFDFPAARVWELLDRFSDTYIYHPIVEHSESTNGRTRGLGARRRCTLYDGSAVEEQVIDHDAEEMRYVVEVVEHGPFPTTSMIVTIQVEPIDATTCKASYDVDFHMKYGPAGWAMGKMIMSRKLESMLGQLLDGAHRHLETGEVVQAAS